VRTVRGGVIGGRLLLPLEVEALGKGTGSRNGDLLMDPVATLAALLRAYVPLSREEARDVDRMRELAARREAWNRSSALHATGSAIILSPESGRVLLRWHARMGSWLHVGGHAEAGEADPLTIALREAREETGLQDLVPWPDPTRPRIVHVAIVPVPAAHAEPAHEHGDIRYVLSTARPDLACAESDGAPLRWVPIEEALSLVAEDNLRVCLRRIIPPAAQRRQRVGPGDDDGARLGRTNGG